MVPRQTTGPRGQPVYMLLGGKLRDRVVCYGAAGTPECARERVEEGWPYLRMSVKVR